MGKAPSPALFAFCFCIFAFLGCHPRRGSAFALLLPSPFLLLPVAFVVACFCRHPERSEGSRGPQTFQRSQPLSHHNLIVAVYQPRQKTSFPIAVPHASRDRRGKKPPLRTTNDHVFAANRHHLTALNQEEESPDAPTIAMGGMINAQPSTTPLSLLPTKESSFRPKLLTLL
jgi:hypothetical protein